jgi:hypothetical protein
VQGETPALNRIVSYETVDAESAPFEPAASKNLPADVSVAYGSEIELADAARLLGREVVWAGTSVNGVVLESVRELRVPAGGADVPGLSLMYGRPKEPLSSPARRRCSARTGWSLRSMPPTRRRQSPPLVPSSPTPAKCPCALGWVRPLEARPAASDRRAATERP